MVKMVAREYTDGRVELYDKFASKKQSAAPGTADQTATLAAEGSQTEAWPLSPRIESFLDGVKRQKMADGLWQGGEAEDSARGRIVIGSNKAMRIELFAKAALSTFLHETGHFYLEVLADLAKEPNANPRLVADYQAVKDWLGETDESLAARLAEAKEIDNQAKSEKRELTKEEKARIDYLVEPFEKWARAFELYLAMADAPDFTAADVLSASLEKSHGSPSIKTPPGN